MVLYILNTIITSGLALLCYQLFLKREKTFVFNRFYLVLSLMACIVAPILSIETESAITLTDVSNALSIESSVALVDDYETAIVEEMNSSSFNFWHLLITFYGIISMLLVLRFLKNLYAIIKLTKPVKQIEGKLKIVELIEASNSFSFFNYIFISKHILKNPEEIKLILKHEKAHCFQKHSIDIILIELLKCLFWFNPFLWLYKRAIVENHEFLADEAVINNGVDIMDYSQSIIRTKKMISVYAMSSGFNMVQTKNRLKMLHQSKSTVIRQLIKTIATLTVFICVFMISVSASHKAPIVVVIDAGHGGKDSGHLNEKDINLSIAKLLTAKSNDEIIIKLLRQEDKFISLSDRAKFINSVKPDLFLSIHCNKSTDVTNAGVEAFYYNKGKYKDASHDFSKLLVSEQLEGTPERGRVKTANFYLLRQIDCPAALLELGFLSNPNDESRLRSANGQLEVVNAIYDALAGYHTF